MWENPNLKIVSGSEILSVPGWSLQLASLRRMVWTDDQGVHFNTNADPLYERYWEDLASTKWRDETQISAVLLEGDNKITAHASIKENTRYGGKGAEIGECFSAPSAHKGAATELCKYLNKQYSKKNLARTIYGRSLGTSTATQRIAVEDLGFRFAGIDFVGNDREWWEVFILYDSLRGEEFVPEFGILGNPLRHNIKFDAEKHRAKLAKIIENLSSDRGGPRPTGKVFVLPQYIEQVREICRLHL